jgi:hypothetical protein
MVIQDGRMDVMFLEELFLGIQRADIEMCGAVETNRYRQKYCGKALIAKLG